MERAKLSPPVSAPAVSLTDKVQLTFKQLSQAATDLNAASDDLARPIVACESVLKKLNLGLSAWVEISSGGSSPLFWDRSIGYTRLSDRWAIAIRTREGQEDAHDDDQIEVEMWAFNDAPRWMRIEAISKLPDLLEALLKQAVDMTQKIRKKTVQANELIEAISRIAENAAVANGK